MSLKDEALSKNSGKGIDFMSDRTKGEMDELIGEVVTIRDYAFITGDDGEYAVFIIDENNEKFYFGGKVITDDLKSFSDEAKAEIKANGLPTLFTKQMNKKGKREYVAVTFYPDEVEEQ